MHFYVEHFLPKLCKKKIFKFDPTIFRIFDFGLICATTTSTLGGFDHMFTTVLSPLYSYGGFFGMFTSGSVVRGVKYQHRIGHFIRDLLALIHGINQITKELQFVRTRRLITICHL